jgi:dihydrolipoamide dehydrogenase
MSSDAYDVIVIGGGSAGYAAARTAAAVGARTAIVEGAKKVGGLCILRGCMPSKTLLESAHRWHEINRANEFGLEVKPKRPRIKAIVARKERLIGGFADYRRKQLIKGPFDFFRGLARFQDAHTISVGAGAKAKTLIAQAFVVATGSMIPVLPLPGLKETGYMTSDEALDVTRLPKSLVVLGGGVIAVELGQYFAHLGSQVTIVQRSPHLIKENDDDVCETLEQKMREDGMTVITGTQLTGVRKSGKMKIVDFTQNGKKRSASGEEILYALGRAPATAGLDLDQAGVLLDGKRIRVDAHMRTSVPHIFAAGDVTGLFEVVHTAISQGEVAGLNAALAAGKGEGRPAKEMDYRLKCTVIFTDPEIASVGLNEKECREQGIAYLTAQYPFGDHGKSVVMGATTGFVKLLAEPAQGEILGAHIVGPHASDLIHELIAVMYYRGTAAQLAVMPHYHPTLAEIITYPAEEIAEMVDKKVCIAAPCQPGSR